jgi:hypothetical protein
MTVFKAITIKKPEQKDVVFVKGMDNFSKVITTLLNGFLLSLGSVDSSKQYKQNKRQ